MPKRDSSFRIEHAVKEQAAAVLAEHGMTLTEGVTTYLLETAHRGEPAITANTEELAFGEYMRGKYGHDARAGEDGGKGERRSDDTHH